MSTNSLLKSDSCCIPGYGSGIIKVLMFADVLKENLDGVSNTIFNFIKHVPSGGFEFMFVTPYPPEKSFGYPVISCPYITFPLNKTYRLAMPQFSKGLKHQIDGFRPDIIHFTTPSLLGLYAVKYAKINNLPLVGTYHTHFAAYVNYYFRFSAALCSVIQKLVWKITAWFYNKCDIALVPTSPIRDEMIEKGLDNKRLYIWGRGVDNALYNPEKRNREFMDTIAAREKKKILFVSRIVMEKDLKTLSGIYRDISKKRQDIVFIITGNGPKLGYLKKRMPDAVFTGGLIKEDLAGIYASSDIFVFPSITETFGNVVLEAMASGLPVIAAASGGPLGIIEDRKTGLLAEPENVADFCSKISYLLDNPGYAKKMGESARAYAVKQQWKNLSADVLNYYEQLSGDRVSGYHESYSK